MNNGHTIGNDIVNIHSVFSHEAKHRPDGIALKHSGHEISYWQLETRSNYLASHLQSVGVRQGDIVAIALPRSIEMITSMLAILKCGAAYLPVDLNISDPRIVHYLNVAEVTHVIAHSMGDNFPFEGRNIISAQDSLLFESVLEDFDAVPSESNDKAYVMFTSGSTGEPKGVVVPHRAVVRLVRDTNYISIATSDRILQFSSPSFDASTFEIWGALLCGATLVLYSGSTIDPNILKKDILDNEITILWLTAALFHLVADSFIDALKSLNILLAGGDVLSANHINRVLETIPDIVVINGYGPTENTTFTCCHVMSKGNPPPESVPIGHAVSGTITHILDEQLCSVSAGTVGELYVSGKGVALGYLGQLGTPNAFFENQSIATGMIYRTGDLVSQNEKGEILFVGRRDNQLKIRGFRVSLEEIRTSILAVDSVSDAIVTADISSSDEPVLLAYVQLRDGSHLDRKSLRTELCELLPMYMIPDKFIVDHSLPITDNGKIDKNAVMKSLREANL